MCNIYPQGFNSSYSSLVRKWKRKETTLFYQQPAPAKVMFITLLPRLVTALWTVSHKKMMESIIKHPSLLLIPAVTGFTFSCRAEARRGSPVNMVSFPWRATWANAVCSAAGCVIFKGMSVWATWDCGKKEWGGSQFKYVQQAADI